MRTPDPLFPAAALLPQSAQDGYVPLAHVHRGIRPFAATLAVVPVNRAGDETTGTRDNEVKQTQRSSDGKMETDAVTIVVTDT